MKSSLIILTRNEISGVKSLIGKIPFSAVDEYFAVDYRSTDGTVQFFNKKKIPVIQQKKPGRAEAFRIGAACARGKYLIFFSPDGNEDPADIPKLIKLLDSGADLAIASRFLPGARNEEDDNIFKMRKWANQGFTLIANIIFNKIPTVENRKSRIDFENRRWKLERKQIYSLSSIFQFLSSTFHLPPSELYITDSINGYRAITKTAFQRLKLDAEGFAVEYQMTIRALKLGLKIAEIPTIEGPRLGGQSGSFALPTGLKFIYYLIREVFIGKNF